MSTYKLASYKTFAITATVLFWGYGALAADRPQQKPGLWQRTSQTTDDGEVGSPRTIKRCIDAAMLAKVKATEASAEKSCRKYDVRLTNGVWIEDSVCDLEQSVVTTHVETRMSGDTKYHSESEVSYSPPLGGSTHSRTIADGEWLGDCTSK